MDAEGLLSSSSDASHFLASKLVGAVASTLTVLFLTPVLYSIIWFDKFGTNQNR
jgi:hypothetical protein